MYQFDRILGAVQFNHKRERMYFTYSAEYCKAVKVKGGWNVVNKKDGDVLEFVSANDWTLAD